jgi:cell division protease FtsH
MEEKPMNLDNKKPGRKPLYVYYIIAAVIIILLNVLLLPAIEGRKVQTTDYSTFLTGVEKDYVKTVEIQDDYIYYVAESDGQEGYFRTVKMNDPDLVDRLHDANVKFGAAAPQQTSVWISLIAGYVLPIAIFILLGRWLSKKMMSSMGGGPGGAMSFGKSNAKVYVKSSTGIKFSDVAGEDEAKDLLTEIVSAPFFFKNAAASKVFIPVLKAKFLVSTVIPARSPSISALDNLTPLIYISISVTISLVDDAYASWYVKE